MFVSEHGRELILRKRKSDFYESFIVPLKEEADKLNISEEQLIKMIIKGGNET